MLIYDQELYDQVYQQPRGLPFWQRQLVLMDHLRMTDSAILVIHAGYSPLALRLPKAQSVSVDRVISGPINQLPSRPGWTTDWHWDWVVTDDVMPALFTYPKEGQRTDFALVANTCTGLGDNVLHFINSAISQERSLEEWSGMAPGYWGDSYTVDYVDGN
jgi:hypothetical protein